MQRKRSSAKKSWSLLNWVIPLGSDQQFEVNLSRKDKRESLRDYSEAKIENLLSCLSPGFDLVSNISFCVFFFTIRRQWGIWKWMKANLSSQHFVSDTLWLSCSETHRLSGLLHYISEQTASDGRCNWDQISPVLPPPPTPAISIQISTWKAFYSLANLLSSKVLIL